MMDLKNSIAYPFARIAVWIGLLPYSNAQRTTEQGALWIRREEWPDWLDPVPVAKPLGKGDYRWVDREEFTTERYRDRETN